MQSLTIGRLATAAGVHVETVRYYQRRGLLALPRRADGGVRRYSGEALERLRFIRRAQALGFSLDEVASLLALDDPRCRDARAIASRKLSLVEARLSDLRRLRAVLRRLIARCDAGATQRCAIIDELAGARSNPVSARTAGGDRVKALQRPAGRRKAVVP